MKESINIFDHIDVDNDFEESDLLAHTALSPNRVRLATQDTSDSMDDRRSEYPHDEASLSSVGTHSVVRDAVLSGYFQLGRRVDSSGSSVDPPARLCIDPQERVRGHPFDPPDSRDDPESQSIEVPLVVAGMYGISIPHRPAKVDPEPDPLPWTSSPRGKKFFPMTPQQGTKKQGSTFFSVGVQTTASNRKLSWAGYLDQTMVFFQKFCIVTQGPTSNKSLPIESSKRCNVRDWPPIAKATLVAGLLLCTASIILLCVIASRRATNHGK